MFDAKKRKEHNGPCRVERDGPKRGKSDSAAFAGLGKEGVWTFPVCDGKPLSDSESQVWMLLLALLIFFQYFDFPIPVRFSGHLPHSSPDLLWGHPATCPIVCQVTTHPCCCRSLLLQPCPSHLPLTVLLPGSRPPTSSAHQASTPAVTCHLSLGRQRPRFTIQPGNQES